MRRGANARAALVKGGGFSRSPITRHAVYWALIPAVLITLPHLAISRFTNAPNSSGVVGTAMAPWASSAAFASGRLRVSTTSRLILVMMAFGVLAGAKRPNQTLESRPGNPA